MFHYPLWPPRKTHPMPQLKMKNTPSSLSGSITFSNRFNVFYKSPMPSTRNAMFNITCHTSFRWETNFGCTYRRTTLRPHREIHPLYYGPYTITKAMGENYFELNLPPFLGFHLVFNVDLLWPYFPPLLDTSEIEEQLRTTDINLDYMERASTDNILDTQVKGTHQ